jgi:hypothetical protein
MKKSNVYYIPYKFRKLENLHILFWLFKDVCWAMNLKIPGLIMIVPTLSVAVLITHHTRKIKSELFHNLAIDFWITANCTWMIGEFFGLDTNLIGEWGLRQLAIIPFVIGLLILAYYYLIYMHKENFEEHVHQQTEQLIKEEAAKASN